MSNGKLLYGRKFDESDAIGTDFTEQRQDSTNAIASIATADAGGLAVEAIPIDQDATLVRTYTPPLAALAAYAIIVPSVADINVPPVLQSLSIVYSTSKGDGNYSDSGSGASAGSYASLTLQLRGSGQTSASITAELLPVITGEARGINRPVIHYMFYMPSPCTSAQVLTRLTALAGATVSAWPLFEPQSIDFLLIGGHQTASAEVSIQQHVLISTANVTRTQGDGKGFNFESSVVSKVVHYPPTLHGALTLSPSSSTITGSAGATASMAGGTNWLAMSETEAATASATASVAPTSIAATTPVAPPTAGLYLHTSRVEPSKWGQARLICEVFDFANL